MESGRPLLEIKKVISPGITAATIIKNQKKIIINRGLTTNDTSAFFTDSLVPAIKRYQHRNGLTEDGIAGASLFKAMSRPISERIRQILINMERIRWVPAQPSTDYLLVNIPEFRVHVYEKGDYVWSMKVVVGASGP